MVTGGQSKRTRPPDAPGRGKKRGPAEADEALGHGVILHRLIKAEFVGASDRNSLENHIWGEENH